MCAPRGHMQSALAVERDAGTSTDTGRHLTTSCWDFVGRTSSLAVPARPGCNLAQRPYFNKRMVKAEHGCTLDGSTAPRLELAGLLPGALVSLLVSLQLLLTRSSLCLRSRDGGQTIGGPADRRDHQAGAPAKLLEPIEFREPATCAISVGPPALNTSRRQRTRESDARCVWTYRDRSFEKD
jgi:hypothetical protein